jgi:putative ABC transport system ATP-binding protein
MYIQVEHATKQYGSGEAAIYALSDASLSIEKGEICVILGPSGSGKSTLLNMLGGLDHLDKGHIYIEGSDISAYNCKQLTEYRRQKLGFVFQSYNLIPELNVRENIRVVADIAASPLDIDELMENLGLSRHATHFPSELSGGQQQRCAIARALVKNPSFLLCDELTGALDSKSSRDVLSLLEKINREYKTTIVMITHNEGIMDMADRVIRIHDGKIVENRTQSKKAVKELTI